MTAPRNMVPQRGDIRQVNNQLFIWGERLNEDGTTVHYWAPLATFDKPSEAAYVGAIVERAVNIAEGIRAPLPQ